VVPVDYAIMRGLQWREGRIRGDSALPIPRASEGIHGGAQQGSRALITAAAGYCLGMGGFVSVSHPLEILWFYPQS
jgi:hypothetical protein